MAGGFAIVAFFVAGLGWALKDFNVQVLQALDPLSNLLGTILNRVSAQTDQYYYYTYYYRYYYSNYGEPETKRPALARSGGRKGD